MAPDRALRVGVERGAHLLEVDRAAPVAVEVGEQLRRVRFADFEATELLFEAGDFFAATLGFGCGRFRLDFGRWPVIRKGGIGFGLARSDF